MGIFWDISQDINIAGANLRAGDASRKSETTTSSVRALEDRIDRLTLICAAMWQLLQVQGGFNEEDLTERVKAIDLLDGNHDGQLQLPVTTCKVCQRPNSRRHLRCIYCGHDLRFDSAFDAVH